RRVAVRLRTDADRRCDHRHLLVHLRGERTADDPESDPRGSDSQTAGRGRRPPLRAARRAEARKHKPRTAMLYRGFCFLSHLRLTAYGLRLTAYGLPLEACLCLSASSPVSGAAGWRSARP